jgi:hypothetical protein
MFLESTRLYNGVDILTRLLFLHVSSVFPASKSFFKVGY